MKRVITCMLVLSLALLLCACGGEQKPACTLSLPS